MKLFLVGLPGCGKSTLSRQLARSLNLPFIDLDDEIEAQENTTLSTLLHQKGEAYFRNREKEQLERFCYSNTSFVMATGGGTPCFFENMAHINKNGKSLFLDVSIEIIFNRLCSSALTPLPLLPKEGEKKISIRRIRELRSCRIDFYQQAHWIFSGDDVSKNIILRKIEMQRL